MGLEPRSPGAGSPPACWRISFHKRVLSVLSPCNSGSSRKWLNPMYFYTEHTPARPDRSSLSIRMGGRAGEVYVGGRVKHKASGPVTCSRTGNSPCQLQAEVTELNVCRGTKYWKTLLKTIALPDSGAGEGGSSVGFLWAFSGHGSTGNAGDTAILKSGLASYIWLGVSPSAPWPSCQMLLPSGPAPLTF